MYTVRPGAVNKMSKCSCAQTKTLTDKRRVGVDVVVVVKVDIDVTATLGAVAARSLRHLTDADHVHGRRPRYTDRRQAPQLGRL